MKRFYCSCGQEVFFDNTFCGACGAQLGFDPQVLDIRAGQLVGKLPVWTGIDGQILRTCTNRPQTKVACNWLLPDSSRHRSCLSCQATRKKPALTLIANQWCWTKLEHVKRSLFYLLLRLGLPVIPRSASAPQGVVFDFVEDQRTNVQASSELLYTGHANGVISINVIEADDVQRVLLQQQMNERYRTLAGHFRHESGHYYWDRLIKGTTRYPAFRALFGDESGYRTAMDRYYLYGAETDWQDEFLSAYASSHPWEDWAESWAHYLHMMDTLETAGSFGLTSVAAECSSDFNLLIQEWMALTLRMNALNRSMGLDDAYPFVLSAPARAKLAFIHQLLGEQGGAVPVALVSPAVALP